MKRIHYTGFLLFALVTLFAANYAEAQKRKIFNDRKKYWTIGNATGVANYHGDLSPNPNGVSFDPKLTRPTVGFDASKRFAPFFSVRAGFSWIQLAGNDFLSARKNTEDGLRRYYRNLHFRNNLFAFSAVGVFDLIPHGGYFMSRNKWTPYAFTGISTFYHAPQAKTPEETYFVREAAAGGGQFAAVVKLRNGGEWVDLRELRTEGKEYSRWSVAIPVGIGVRYAVSPVINLGFELSYNPTLTDHLDDVSGRYADIRDDNALRVAMANRSAEATDAYTGRNRDLLRILSGNGDALAGYAYSDGTEYVAVKNVYTQGDTRGDTFNKDSFLMTTLRVEYIIGKGPTPAKLR